jgi:hypothetical protein
LLDRRRRTLEEMRSNWDMVNAIRLMLGLDPIAENNGRRGKRYAAEEAEE